MSKRAIILGGAGLIGSHLCIRLLSEGYDVVCIDKRNRRESHLLRSIDSHDRFHYIEHDITKPYEIGCDELYNLATPVEHSLKSNFIENQRTTALGALNSLDVVVGSNTRVLYASSDDVYNFEKPEFNYNSDKQFTAEAKRFGESIYRAYNAQYKVDVRIARIFSTYGANAGLRDQHVIGKMIVQALNNHDITIYGNGEQVRTFCWVEDMVSGLISLMRTHSATGILSADLGSTAQVTIRQLAELIISLTGSSSSIFHIATRVDEPHYKIPNLKTSRNKLNWEATTTLREGLQRTISYIEKELSSIALDKLSWVEIYS